jgi:hypothetical protein
MSSSLTPRNSSRRALAGRPAALAAAALLFVGGVAAGCGGSDDDDAAPAPTSTSPGLAGPDLSDADQRVVSVLLGFVRVVGEQGDRLEACSDGACRERVGASLQEAGDGVEAALDEAGEPSECIAGVADALRSAADSARAGGDDVLDEVRAELSQASSAAGAC